MTVISDTSVLIHLARIDRFDLLPHLSSEITVPETAWQETVSGGKGQPGTPELQSARATGWIELRARPTITPVHLESAGSS
jgi:predicted nucleic acid-binding protein